MADIEKVSFEITGEVPEDRLGEMVEYLGGLGVQVRSGTELDPVSPSILIEYVEGPNGLPLPVVTQQTVEEFMISEGGDEQGSVTNAHQFMWTLSQHTDKIHKSRGGLNSWCKPCQGCDCPLRSVLERATDLGSNFMPHMGGLFPRGLDPQSLIEFSNLSLDEARQKVQGLGVKRYQMVGRIAARLQADMAQG